MMILFTESGMVLPVSQSNIETFISEMKMNVEMVVIGNNSPLGDGDPSFDIEEFQMISEASEFLDDNLESVCQSYLNTILINNLLKHVA